MLIKLDFDRGANIQFTLCIKNKFVNETIQYFSSFFDKFIDENSSSEKDLKSTRHFLFSNFENNTIHYGIHDYFIKPIADEYNLHHNLGVVLIHLLKENRCDISLIKTKIIIQIFTLFCKISKLTIGDTIFKFENLLSFEYARYSTYNQDEYTKMGLDNFENNKEDLIEYIEFFLWQKNLN
ncbi:hypothetical protein [Flagellimonas onchidii]|uniref:hypothetical protein n=1 Tax=Flagellimonas onchidii TaxID=2562684 RepID=UPI0010A5B598|nr:hypothetical protein [Allomuricauda onchidii]